MPLLCQYTLRKVMWCLLLEGGNIVHTNRMDKEDDRVLH